MRRSVEVTTKPRKRTSAVKDSDAERAACRCAQIADAKKGREILILDLRRLTFITDFFVIITATNPRQIRAIARAIEEEMGRRGARPIGLEGTDESGWVLLDYSDVVIHLFDTERRRLYDLELLWGDAPRVLWQDAKDDKSTPP